MADFMAQAHVVGCSAKDFEAVTKHTDPRSIATLSLENFWLIDEALVDLQKLSSTLRTGIDEQWEYVTKETGDFFGIVGQSALQTLIETVRNGQAKLYELVSKKQSLERDLQAYALDSSILEKELRDIDARRAPIERELESLRATRELVLTRKAGVTFSFANELRAAIEAIEKEHEKIMSALLRTLNSLDEQIQELSVAIGGTMIRVEPYLIFWSKRSKEDVVAAEHLNNKYQTLKLLRDDCESRISKTREVHQAELEALRNNFSIANELSSSKIDQHVQLIDDRVVYLEKTLIKMENRSSKVDGEFTRESLIKSNKKKYDAAKDDIASLQKELDILIQEQQKYEQRLKDTTDALVAMQGGPAEKLALELVSVIQRIPVVAFDAAAGQFNAGVDAFLQQARNGLKMIKSGADVKELPALDLWLKLHGFECYSEVLKNEGITDIRDLPYAKADLEKFGVKKYHIARMLEEIKALDLEIEEKKKLIRHGDEDRSKVVETGRERILASVHPLVLFMEQESVVFSREQQSMDSKRRQVEVMSDEQ